MIMITIIMGDEHKEGELREVKRKKKGIGGANVIKVRSYLNENH
jgi:hypothetical protein